MKRFKTEHRKKEKGQQLLVEKLYCCELFVQKQTRKLLLQSIQIYSIERIEKHFNPFEYDYTYIKTCETYGKCL